MTRPRDHQPGHTDQVDLRADVVRICRSEHAADTHAYVVHGILVRGIDRRRGIEIATAYSSLVGRLT
jgi:hypothetical protein